MTVNPSQELGNLMKEARNFSEKLEKQQETLEALVEDEKRLTDERMKDILEWRSE